MSMSVRDFYIFATAWNATDAPKDHIAYLRERNAQEFDEYVRQIREEAWESGRSAMDDYTLSKIPYPKNPYAKKAS